MLESGMKQQYKNRHGSNPGSSGLI